MNFGRLHFGVLRFCSGTFKKVATDFQALRNIRLFQSCGGFEAFGQQNGSKGVV